MGNCVHYWIIEPPEGATSTGICKLCGAKEVFLNVIPQTIHGKIREGQYKRYNYNETKMSLFFRNQSRNKQISLDPFDGNEGVYSL